MPIKKPIKEALKTAEKASHYANLALEAARICDFERTERIGNLADHELRAANKKLAQIPTAINPMPAGYGIYLDKIKRLIADAKSAKAAAEQALKKCLEQQAPIFPYVPGSATHLFKLLKPGDPKPPPNRIDFVYKLEVRCEKPAFIQVYHIEKDETGEALLKPSKGDKRSSGFPLMSHFAPRDQDAFDGYVVDADPNGKEPSLHTDTKNGVAQAFDMPDFVKKGYTAYFETCLVCMDGDEYKILTCIRWTSKGPDGEVRMDPTKDCQPSLNFERALQHWLNQH